MTGMMVPEFILTDQLIAWGNAHSYSKPELEAHMEYFLDYLENKPGKPYKNLPAAFRNCVRGDWGNVRRQMKSTRIAPATAPSFGDARPGESMEDYLNRKRREQAT